jgi:cytochrome b561
MAAHRTRYSPVAILLHWLIAALIFTNIWYGWRMGSAKGLAQFQLFQLHKSIGVTVLLLSLARIGWRLVSPPPAAPATMSCAVRLAAGAAHGLLYGFMIMLPLTGWVVVSASPYNLPTLLFKTVPWPHIGLVHDLPIMTRKLIEDQVGSVHAWLAWSLLALAAFHIAAALKHHLLDRDDVLARMLPLLRRSASSAPVEI